MKREFASMAEKRSFSRAKKEAFLNELTALMVKYGLTLCESEIYGENGYRGSNFSFDSELFSVSIPEDINGE